MPDAPFYDREKQAWVPQCPHGDVCSGCDARGYCTRAIECECEEPDCPYDHPIPEREAFISTLADHALVEIRCDHDAKTDTPACNCAVVELGAHTTVQAAKEAWAAHVWEVLNG